MFMLATCVKLIRNSYVYYFKIILDQFFILIIIGTHLYLLRPPLVSDVIGISLQCDDQICPTSNISLAQPVVITFQHSSSLTVSYPSMQCRSFHHEFISGCAEK